MSTETVESSGKDSPPLRLFTYSEDALRDFDKRMNRANQVKSSIISARNVLKKYEIEINKRCINLNASSREIFEDGLRADSSSHCGGAYLLILDSVLLSGGTEFQAYDFFKWCLRAHETVTNNVIVKGLNVFKDNIADQRTFDRELALGFNHSFERFKTPDWFKGSRTQFKVVCFKYFFLSAECDVSDGAINVKEGRVSWFAGTKSDGYPDWLDWASEIPPERAVVEAELKEDLATIINSESEITSRNHQFEQMQSILNSRIDKFVSWGNKKIEESYEKVFNLASLVIDIDQLDATGIFGFDKTEAELEVSIYNRLYKANKKFPGRFTYPDFVALWIDQKLRESGLTYSPDKPLSTECLRLFELCLTNNTEELRKYKETNKKTFRIFNYDIRSLFSVLSSEDKEILLIYLHDDPDMSATNFLDFLMNAVYEPAIKNKEMLEKFSEYGMKWIARNWKQAYEQLQAEIRKMREGKEIHNIEREEEYDEQEVVEKEITSLQTGNLEGWEVFYFTNRNDPMNSKYWELVNGSTIDERVANLTDLITKNRIICPVKPSTLHGYLEDIVNTPDEVENVRMTVDIGGVRFKKRKKAESTRVFYKMDRGEKRLIFNLYHKEDWGYRKL